MKGGFNEVNNNRGNNVGNNNNISGNTNNFDATSAGVFIGMGRRYNASIKLNF